MARHLLRLVVPTPDRSRVLARPNGLAGWALPAVPVEAPDDGPVAWTATIDAAAARLLGTAVAPVRAIGPDAWEVAPRGRIPRSGVTWIAPDEGDRLGPDAAIVRAWSAGEDAAG